MRIFLIGIFWMGGVVLGWDTAAATHRPRIDSSVAPKVEHAAAAALPQSATVVVVPVPTAPLNRELETLTIRNRRLEALVRVLRNRQAERQP